MRKRETILLVRNAAKHDFGGAETYPVSLANILKDMGYKPILVTRSEKLLKYAKGESVKTHRGWWWSRQNWSGWRVSLFPIYILWQIVLTIWYIQLIVRTRALAAHVQSRDDFIAATIAGRIMGIKVIWTDHMDLRYVFESISKNLRNPVGKFVFLAAHIAHHIILISDNEYRLVTAHFKNKHSLEKQIILIKNGVIDRGVKDRKQKRKRLIFCLASRMVVNKGVGEAISAFKILQKRLSPRDSSVQLAIYGDGADTDIFRDLASSDKNIIFYGHQNNAIDKVRDTDVFILPSYQEGFSIALLEASMLGKAIIASDVDSNSEIISHKKTGLLVKVRDTKDLSDAMYLLATDSALRHKLEDGARRNFEQNFDLVKIAKDKIIPLYRYP